jgi:hypothetical protein
VQSNGAARRLRAIAVDDKPNMVMLKRSARFVTPKKGRPEKNDRSTTDRTVQMATFRGFWTLAFEETARVTRMAHLRRSTAPLCRTVASDGRRRKPCDRLAGLFGVEARARELGVERESPESSSTSRAAQ